MTRVGPNQDINDPTTILRLLGYYQNSSNEHGLLTQQYNNKDINDLTGTPLIDISIPFVQQDRSIKQFTATDMDFETHTGKILNYDTTIIKNADIRTYINLPELFRSYWIILNNNLPNIKTFNQLFTEIIGPFPYSPTVSYGSLKTTTFIYILNSIGSESFQEPVWSGTGPVNYNINTYEQLLNNLETPQYVTSLIRQWRTGFYYSNIGRTISRFYRAFGANISIGQIPTEFHYVRFYNNTPTNMSINFSVQLDHIGHIESWAEIQLNDSLPLLFDLEQDKSRLSSYITVDSIQYTRNISLPPDRYLFIGGGVFSTINGEIFTGTLTMDGQTISF